jgi:hypothetical protein
MVMKNLTRLTLIPFLITGLLFLFNGILLAQTVLSDIETKNLEYTAGDGQVAVTSTIQVDARFYIYSATIRISEGYNSSEDKLVYTGTYYNISSSWNKSTGTMTLTGFASENRYRTALRNIQYENTNIDNPSTETRTVSFSVYDGANSNTVSRKITIIQDNLPPVISNIETEPAILCMNSGSMIITESLTISDADDAELVSALVTIATGYTSDDDRLLFTAQNGITGTWNSNAGNLALSGTASVADYQQALRSIRFQNNDPENPHTGLHDITYTVSDGILQSNSLSRSIIHSVPSANISGDFSICRDEDAAIRIEFTGTAPWQFSYRINSGTPKTVQNISTNPYLMPARDQGTYTLTEINDKNCPGKVSGNAVVEILPEPVVSITGLDPAYSRESTDMIPLTGNPDGGTFSGPGVVPYGEDWYFFPSLPFAGVHQIVYKYRVDANSCYGYDTATVRILERSAAIELPNERVHFCNNEIPFVITGINLLNNNPGSFTITGGKGIIDHGNNSATIFPDSLEINQYTITYTASGGIQATMDIDIGGPLTANFSWSAECFTSGQAIAFTNTSLSPFGFLSNDSYRWKIFSDGDSIEYSTRDVTSTFPEPGNYLVKLRIRNSYGCVNESEKNFPLRPVFALAGNAYSEDFEGVQHWESGYNPDKGSNSWQLGNPDQMPFSFPHPYSGENCWFTKIENNPVPVEQSWITSPCFDFSGTEKPTLVSRIWRSFTDTRDGSYVSYTTDNGLHWNPVGTLNGGINWFNGYFGTAGSQSQGWTAITDPDWVEARHILDFLTNEPVVQFRFTFTASGSALGNKGIAVDDIRIVERNRTILIEHFTNTSDESSIADNMLDGIVLLSGPNVIDLQYHASDPDDPFYLQNPMIPTTRQFYYGLTDVPFSLINGGALINQRIDYEDRVLSQSQIGIESLYDSEFDLKVTTMRDGNNLHAEAIITALQDVPLHELTLRMVVIEPLIIDSTDSGEDSSHRNVVRAMLPDAAGNSVYRIWQKGEQYRIVESWDIENTFNPDGLRVVAFIQNELTRVIHQAAMDVPGLVNDAGDLAGTKNDFIVFPNPAGDYLNIEFFTENRDKITVELINNLGVPVYSQGIKDKTLHTIKLTGIPDGIYILRVYSTNNQSRTSKIIITR